LTPTQLLAAIDQFNTATNNLNISVQNLKRLRDQVVRRTDQSNPLNVPLTQADATAILAAYLSTYQTNKAACIAAANALP